MIKQIILKDTASYNIEGVTFSPSQINFMYGSNGSGKTVLSNVLNDINSFTSCNIDWGHGTAINSLVYNKGFVESNFEQSQELRGIFTLGKESKEEIEKIQNCKTEIDKKNSEIVSLKGTLETIIQDFTNVENTFKDNTWAAKVKYDITFSKAFEGFRGSKVSFKDKVIAEYRSNKEPIIVYPELEKKANTILNGEQNKVPPIPAFVIPDFATLETNPILQARIIGKDDIDIAKMILTLNNSDWVRQGLEYYKVNNNICPFCQQDTTNEFKEQLDKYFDETYNQQIQSLKSLRDKYALETTLLERKIQDYISLNNVFIDLQSLNNLKSLIISICEKNKLTIEKKLSEPTLKVEIESLTEHLTKLTELIEQAINKTKEHNQLIDNIDTERTKLIIQIWSYIISELKEDCENYEKALDSFNKAKKGIEDKEKGLKADIKKLEGDIRLSESKITSIQPTIDGINKILSSFGYTNFKLKETGKAGTCKIIREDGSDAKRTLSEGEKTFITFLYFYHLIYGSFDKTQITADKIVVIDDPISSLDSSILFIISSLVRKVIADCRQGLNNIKQVFILTHNVYFHKEVCFKKREDSNKGESFWIIKKINNISCIDKHKANPIQNSYQLLWDEIRNKDKRNNLTIFNTLRRILEFYFKILGRIKDDELLNQFEGEEKLISNSLLSWINDGSHDINDDVFIATDAETIDKYIGVFRRIFEVTGQVEHYKMMMREAT